MAIMSQLISPEEFARLEPEVQERIQAFVRAGGSVAEVYSEMKVPVEVAESRRFQRKNAAVLESARAAVQKYVAELTAGSPSRSEG